MAEKNPFFGATFAERKAARLAAADEPAPKAKQVDEESTEVEDKAVAPAKTTRKRTTAKKKG